MTPLKGWFALAAGIALVLVTACSRHAGGEAANARSGAVGSENADAFVAGANSQLENDAAALQRALMAARTASDTTTQKLVTDAEVKHLALLDRLIEQSARFDGQTLKPETARAIERLRLNSPIPVPHDSAKISEIAAITTRMQSTLADPTKCYGGDRVPCRTFDDLETVLRNSRDYDERLAAWLARQTNQSIQRKDYARFVELANEGAKRLGFADAGEYQRARYDMDADELRAQTDRLWSQVKPLYYQLQCYARVRLVQHYGERAQSDGMIRLHLAADFGPANWQNQWDLLAPFANATAPWTGVPTTPDNERLPFLFRHRNGDPLANALAEIDKTRNAMDLSIFAPNPVPPANIAQATINAQMGYALDTFATMAFAMASEHWRWGVFNGSIRPADYNKAWWALRAKYEGFAPPASRDEDTFDAGATYAITANYPQAGPFLARFLQFQIERALCKTAMGGSRYGCDFERDATALKLYQAMLERGASQPWQKTLKEFTGEDAIDAGALLEYFAPLRAWLERQNKGESCGWEGNFASGPSSSTGDAPPQN